MAEHKILIDKNLALFFSLGVSLKLWHEIGMIDREVAIYNELSKYFKHIYLLTYGDEEDLTFKRYLADNITIVPKKNIPNNLLYSFILPLIHRKILKKVDILKTNQMSGSWSAALTKLIYRNKLVVRTGYMWSINFSRANPRSWKNVVIKRTERFAYSIADAVITSSQRNFDYVKQYYRPHNHILIPNYVETEVFRPLSVINKKKGSICFIGRLSQVKNLLALLEALKGAPYCIDIIGSGPQSSQLQEAARSNGVKATFMGNIQNHELPRILNEHELFVLPSLWENMPKTLLEAMACGLLVIGTNVEGIKEVVKHGQNGVLCDTNSKSIRQAIVSVMEDEGLKQRLGEKARKTIEQRFSLEKLINKELGLYVQLLT
ncbi:glycosyltransferase family 4 protein [Chloroflexota bacterium]